METQPGISLKHRPIAYNCIHWNDAGQLGICTEHGVHVMTPVLTGLSSKIDNYAHAGLVIPSLERLPHDTDPAHPNELEASYFNEEAPRSIAWSSSGLSLSQSCFLTVITTKHRVLVYEASTKDPLTSEWKLYADITDRIQRIEPDKSSGPTFTRHFTLSASWSKTLSIDVVSPRFAILALSNKIGNINLWVHSLKSGFQHAAQVTPYEAHVNLLDWTKWKKIGKTTFLAFVTSGSTDGRVALSSVQVELMEENENWKIKKVKTKCLYSWFEDNIAIPTFLKTSSELKNDLFNISIAVSKGSFIYFLSIRVESNGNTYIEGDWLSHNMIHTGVGLSGGTWETPAIFRGYTFEGEGVYLRLNNGVLEEDKTATHLLNQKLIQKFKQQWMEEQLKTEDDDVFGASDATPCLWGASDGINNIVTAIYCTMKPTLDVHYRLESAEDSVIVFILQKERGVNTQDICDDLQSCIQNPETVFNIPLRGILRETMELLVDEENPNIFFAWLSQLQEFITCDFESSNNNFVQKLYGTPSMISSFIINIIELELKHHDFFKHSAEFIEASKKAKNCTKTSYFNVILDYALKITDNDLCCFGQNEITDTLLLLDQTLTVGNQTLAEKSLKMYEKIEVNFPGLDLKEEIEFASNFSAEAQSKYTPKPREKCPVCEELVGSVNGTYLAQCSTGHIWELCRITYKVLAEPTMRKCLACGAKSLKIPNDKSFSTSILKMCCNCINCGSSFF